MLLVPDIWAIQQDHIADHCGSRDMLLDSGHYRMAELAESYGSISFDV